MCGIMGYIGKKENANKVLIDGLEHLEYRGYDSSGIAYIHNNKLIIQKEVGKIANLKKLINYDDKSHIGIGHTRWATHGTPSKINAHPHNYKSITIVHNGIIENYDEIKTTLKNMGYSFKSETDTEVAAILLYEYYHKTKDMLLAIQKFKKRVIGSYAISIICIDNPDTLYIVKNHSPLIIGITNDSKYIASDVPAILNYTNKYLILEDGDYGIITANEVTIYNDLDKITNPKINIYEGDNNVNSKQGYDHYMLKEIYEQSDIPKNYLTITDFSFLDKYKKITIIGCGSAIYAGYIGKYLIEKYAGIPVNIEIASEFRYKPFLLDKDTLVIAISQSGETADTLESVKIVKDHHIDTLGIINVKESSIARIVDHVIYTKCGPEIAVATTKAYFNQVLILSMMAYYLSKDKKNKNIKNYLKDLKCLPIIIEETLNRKQEYLNIAKKIVNTNDIFYIGREIDYGVSMEGSLKLKEIAYIHSESYPAGELKHGTISLIEKDLPVLGIVTDKNIASKTISNLKEVKTRGAYVIYLTTSELKEAVDFYDEIIILKKVNELLQPLINIIPLQLLAYYTAKLKNLDIDKPKNLAKSVTVE